MDDFDLAGMGEPARVPAAWPEPARRALAIGGGCTLLVLLEFAVIWLIVSLTLNARPPEGLVAQASLPARAAVGQKLPLRITVRNQGPRPFTVRALAVRPDTLRGFKLENPTPAPRLGKTALLGVETWTFEQPVAPKAAWSVTLDATPRQAGKLRGVVEIQAGSGITPAVFTVEVRAAPPAAPAGR
jgi:hypothetical protein